MFRFRSRKIRPAGLVPIPKSAVPPAPPRNVQLGSIEGLDTNVGENDIRLILSQTNITLSDFDGVDFSKTILFSAPEIAVLLKVKEYLEKKGHPTNEQLLLRKWHPAIATLLRRQTRNMERPQ